MIAIRQVARKVYCCQRDDFIKLLATKLGNKRLGPKNKRILSGHVRAAVRREIIQSFRGEIDPYKIKIDQFTDDDLRAALISVTRKRTTYNRTDLMRAIARHLGFGKLTAPIRTRLKSTLNSAIRRNIMKRVSSSKVLRL